MTDDPKRPDPPAQAPITADEHASRRAGRTVFQMPAIEPPTDSSRTSVIVDPGALGAGEAKTAGFPAWFDERVATHTAGTSSMGPSDRTGGPGGPSKRGTASATGEIVAVPSSDGCPFPVARGAAPEAPSAHLPFDARGARGQASADAPYDEETVSELSDDDDPLLQTQAVALPVGSALPFVAGEAFDPAASELEDDETLEDFESDPLSQTQSVPVPQLPPAGALPFAAPRAPAPTADVPPPDPVVAPPPTPEAVPAPAMAEPPAQVSPAPSTGLAALAGLSPDASAHPAVVAKKPKKLARIATMLQPSVPVPATDPATDLPFEPTNQPARVSRASPVPLPDVLPYDPGNRSMGASFVAAMVRQGWSPGVEEA